MAVILLLNSTLPVPLKREKGKGKKNAWKEVLEGSLSLDTQRKGMVSPKVFPNLPPFAFISIY